MSDNEQQNLRVTRLLETNCGCIESIDIQPGRRRMIVLKGANEKGKTTALRHLEAALAGKRSRPDVPVMKGKDEGSVLVMLGDGLKDRYEVTLRYRKGKADLLSVVDLSGEARAKLKAGQTLLDSLFSDLSFDPLRFTHAEGKTQTEMLLKAAGKQAEYEQLQAQRADVYDQRTDANREAKSLKAQLAACPAPASDETLERVSDEDIAKQMRDAQAYNAEIEQLARQSEDAEAELLKAQEESEEAARVFRYTEERVKGADAASQQADAAFEKAPQPISTNDLQAKLEEAREQNVAYDAQVECARLTGAVVRSEDDADVLSGELEAIDSSVVGLLEDSSLGVEDLEIVDGEIRHNKLPFSQASGMRRLDISTRIGMAANPTLRIMLIDEASPMEGGQE